MGMDHRSGRDSLGVATLLPGGEPPAGQGPSQAPFVEPRSIVLESVKEVGASQLVPQEGKPVPLIRQARPLRELLREHFPAKRYVTPYEVVGESSWPRLNAPVLPELRRSGVDIRCGWMAVDLDFRPQGPGTPKGSWGVFDDALQSILEKLGASPLLAQITEPTAFYTTRHGARAIYVLTRPVSPEEYERGALNLVRYWQRAIAEAGVALEVDEACLHWNALFALPHVADESGVFSEEPWFRYVETEARLDPSRFVEVDHEERSARAGGSAQPTPETRGITLDVLQAGGYITDRFLPSAHAEHGRAVIQRMLGVDLFGEEPIAAHGGRDDTLTKVAGAVAHMIRSQGGTLEEAAAFLVWPGAVLNEHETEHDARDWIAAGIEKLCRFWSRDYSPSRVGSVSAQLKREAVVESAATMLRAEPHVMAMAGIVHAQIGDPDLLSPDPDKVRTALKRSLVFARQRPDGSVPDTHFYLLPNGFYSRIALKNPAADQRFQEVLAMLGEDRSSFLALSHEARALVHGNVISQPDQLLFWPGESDLDPTTVRLARTSSGLAVQSYQLKRSPGEAKRSLLVEGWLRALAGEQFERLQQWIAAALAVEEGPVPALFLYGESDAGKTLLIEQLCRSFSGPGGQCSPTAGATLLGGFEDGLEACPVVAFDEAAGNDWSRGESSLIFRRLAGCRQFVAKRKFKAPANCRIAYRVICAANNPNGIKAMLAGDTREDTDGVARRLLVVAASPEAKEYLRRQRIPDREFLEHFRWLYSLRRELGVAEPGGYMLVQPHLGPISRDEALAESVIGDHRSGNELDLIAQYICEVHDLKTWVDEEMGGYLLVSSAHAAEWLRSRNHDPSCTAKRLAMQLRRLVQGLPTRMYRGGEQRRVVCISPDKLGLLLRETNCDVNKFIARAQAAGYRNLDRVLAILGKQ